MPNELKGTKTEENLWKAFIGESQARNKYTIYAKVAMKEGYQQIAAMFLEAAENERVHAKLHFRALGQIGDTMENLMAAAEGENEEAVSMYPDMAETAKEEGFEELAQVFEGLAKIEAAHEERFKKFLANLNDGTVFQKSENVKWKCRECGYIHEGTTPPEVCPVCKHPKGFYEVMAQNY